MTQLPRMSPTAISGVPANATALMPVASSGREVTVAIRASPTHEPVQPVMSAIRSP